MEVKDINDYNNCHKVAEEIAHAMSAEKVNMDILEQTLAGNEYNDTLFKNLSSEEHFSQMHDMLKEAYENRDDKKLIQRIQAREHQRKFQRRLIVGFSTSVAAAMIAVSFYLFNGKDALVPEDVIAQVEVPILMVNNNVIKLEDKKEGKIKAIDYIDSTSTVVAQENTQRLIVPKGFTYNVVLADGTEVILNAASELTYPASFNGGERCVTLKGEAFFKVTKSDKPFIVHSGGAFVKVYGTSFNVNSRNANWMTVVLVEGSVGVGADHGKEVKIAPSQMAKVNVERNECSVSEVDVNDYLGWTNGLFMYNNVGFEVLVKELALWYNVKFNYSELEFSDVNINISLSRDSELNDVFRFIENIANVKFIKERSNEYSIIAQ